MLPFFFKLLYGMLCSASLRLSTVPVNDSFLPSPFAFDGFRASHFFCFSNLMGSARMLE